MSVAAHFAELWRHRVLVEVLVAREIKARYRGSVLGYVWTLLHPLLLLGTYWLVFSVFTRAVDVPRYPLFLFAGVLPWIWISSSVTAGTASIVNGASLVTRTNVPPQVLPAVTVLANLVNLLLGLPVAVAASAVAGAAPWAALAILVPVVLLATPFVYGATLLGATLAVRWRDVVFLAQSLVLLWFFLTPVVYPLSGLRDAWARTALALNPATAIVVPFQDVLHAGRLPEAGLVGAAAVWALAGAAVGAWVFERRRATLAECL